jgi:hypothetical protein
MARAWNEIGGEASVMWSEDKGRHKWRDKGLKEYKGQEVEVVLASLSQDKDGEEMKRLRVFIKKCKAMAFIVEAPRGAVL